MFHRISRSSAVRLKISRPNNVPILALDLKDTPKGNCVLVLNRNQSLFEGLARDLRQGAVGDHTSAVLGQCGPRRTECLIGHHLPKMGHLRKDTGPTAE